MSIFFLDFEGGNDANDGTTFANRWKTLQLGATAARTNPGDTIRYMASPPETLVGDVLWTDMSKILVLPAAVTLNISDCESAWTGSANVTTTLDAITTRAGAGANKNVIAAGFTTGKVSFFATGDLDLSAYQQVSFWVRNTTGATTANSMSLRLCSDVAGDTTVHTIPVPASPAAGPWFPVTLDFGTPLSSSIKSVALYADLDPGTLTINIDNVLACKASSSPDSLTLSSLLGKVHNKPWLPSTPYVVGSIRRPTAAGRNGYKYTVTAQTGNTGASEPVWPIEIGVTVNDGGVTWTCEGLEDTWYGIKGINGTSVTLDNSSLTDGASGRGYTGTTETIATYKRECIRTTTMATSSTASIHTVMEGGALGTPNTHSGGWDRTSMSTKDGETWFDGGNGYGRFIVGAGRAYCTYDNLHAVRCGTAIWVDSTGLSIKNCSGNNCNTAGISIGNSSTFTASTGPIFGLTACNCSGVGLDISNTLRAKMRAVRTSNNIGAYGMTASSTSASVDIVDMVAKNNTSASLALVGSLAPVSRIYGLITGGNGTRGMDSNIHAVLTNATIPESTTVNPMTAYRNVYVWFHKLNGQANNHLGVTDGGTIVSATDQRHTAADISWKFLPNNLNRSVHYPMAMSIAKVKVLANIAKNITIWTRRDNTNIKGILSLAGGQIAGVPADVEVACEPTINTWVQSGSLTFTPTEDGVIEINFKVYDGIGTTNNFWIDDVAIT